ncbi:MAG: dethiobiotin synthase [Candidatus Sumerlaeaceae bacterium]
MAAQRKLIGPGLFVTGTGTGVGKTIVSASLLSALRLRGIAVGAIKPVATGVNEDSAWQDDDAKLLAAASGETDLRQVSPCRMAVPVAPLTAGRLAATPIDIDHLLHKVRERITANEFTVVEGVGGAAVPLTDNTLLSDFAAEVGLPVLVVARTDLGTVNHTLLTIEHLRSRGCVLHGLVFVRHSRGSPSVAETTGPKLATEISGLIDFGTVPYCGDLQAMSRPRDAVDKLPIFSDAIQTLATSITS